MLSTPSRPCPSCREPMTVQSLQAQHGGTVDIDFCFGCHGLWFDPMENLKLSPQAIVTMFKAMHQHADEPHTPLATRLGCPTCHGRLVQGFDLVRSGRYITHRCEQRHGRFSSFSAFMIEKGFVRQLTQPEIADIAAKVGVIHCSSCGAPVDLRKEDACSHCRSALSLLDPKAVEQALQSYATKSAARQPSPESMGDAIVTLARDRARLQREDARNGHRRHRMGDVDVVDLFTVGLGLISVLWDD